MSDLDVLVDDVLQHILSMLAVPMQLVADVELPEQGMMPTSASSRLRFLDPLTPGPGPLALSLVCKRFLRIVRNTPALWRFSAGREVSERPLLELQDRAAFGNHISDCWSNEFALWLPFPCRARVRRVLIELAGGKENSQAWDLSLFKIASFRTDLNVAVDLAPLPDDPGRIPRQRVRSQPLPPLGSPVPTFELNQCWYRIGYTFFNLPASHALDLGPDDPAEPESWVRSWCPPANPANIPMGCPPGLNLNRIVSVSPSFHVERGELLGLEFDSPMPANPIYEDKPDPFPSICWTIWYRSALSEKYKVPTVVFMDQVEDNWLAIARTAVPGIGFECEVLFDD